MLEVIFVFAEPYYRDPHTPTPQSPESSGVSAWVGVQGFLAGLAFSVLGLAAVAVFSDDENRARRTGWAIGGVLIALALISVVA